MFCDKCEEQDGSVEFVSCPCTGTGNDNCWCCLECRKECFNEGKKNSFEENQTHPY